MFGTKYLKNLLNNCNIKNFISSYDSYDAVLEISNSTLDVFHCTYTGTWNPNLNITLENCIIDNSASERGLYILQGNFNYDSSKKKTFIFKNCTFKNGTKIANEETLGNMNINWILEGNKFE